MNNQLRNKIRRNARWLLRLTALNFVASIVLLCQSIFAQDGSLPVLELKESYMNQTVFFIKIYENGRIYYQGNKIIVRGESTQGTAIIGEQYSQITKLQVKELIDRFLSLPFKLHEKYGEKLFGPDIDISYHINFAHSHLNIEVVDRVFFSVMTTKLKKLMEIEKWVCYPKGHSLYDEYCLQDTTDAQLEEFK